MLNWLKNQTLHNWSSAPIVNDGETIIDATAAQIYEKLDFATPLNAYRERGYVFGAGNPAYDIFEATDPGEPGKTLIFEVTEARPGKRYCYRTTIRDADADCPVIRIVERIYDHPAERWSAAAAPTGIQRARLWP